MRYFFGKVQLALCFLSLRGPKRILRLTYLNNSPGASAQGRQWWSSCAGDPAVSPTCRVSQCWEAQDSRHIPGKLLCEWEGSVSIRDDAWASISWACTFPEQAADGSCVELSCSSHNLAAPAEPWWLFNGYLGNPRGRKSTICSHLKTIFCWH